ncbi:hypothetical protein Clocl_2231 [Acetivibrio clariflavus DSM 19732]|uniref:Uncharacterized protein n=1 Tax=Acetivibrio clariflavus (strain DSM 19732 / NBRC 101661 / EBR45) TaxID=720554 RepID=G8LXS0_ACECE|nr:hypothetical protein Clocl_2231 [Acetivibrio clariflavus DSM 19732]
MEKFFPVNDNVSKKLYQVIKDLYRVLKHCLKEFVKSPKKGACLYVDGGVYGSKQRNRHFDAEFVNQ